MNFSRFLIIPVALVCLCLHQPHLLGQDKKKDDAKADKKAKTDEGLTLETIFPKKSLFGPSARSSQISESGRYGAYLYRTNKERRHGNDIWVYDFQTGKTKRITSVSVMAEFQKSVREVRDDRVKKAKKSTGEKKEDTKEEGKKGKAANKKKKESNQSNDDEAKQNGDWVSEKDADDEKAPRYRGISSFVWHPEKDEMLFSAGGDIFHLPSLDAKPVRLTKTEASESRAKFLEDGTGYTYSADNKVYRVKFDSHLIEQISPDLKSNLTLGSYALSPNEKYLVMTASSGSVFGTSDRKVNIAKYRGRFAEVNQVSRAVSDDKLEPQDQYVYLYNIENEFTEGSELIEIFHEKVDEPRDGMSSPNWSPDSSKLTFSVFDHKTSQFHIHLATLPKTEAKNDDKEDKPKKKKKKRVRSASENKKKNDGELPFESPQDSDDGEKGDKEKEGDKDDKAEYKSKVVYKALHFGGPMTPRMIEPEFAWDSRNVVFVSEQSGFRHLHMLDTVYQTVHQLTQGNYEVYPQGMNKSRKAINVTATKDNATQTNIYCINLMTGDMHRIGKLDGSYSNVAISNDGKNALANYITYGKATELVAIKGNATKVLTDSHKDSTLELIEAKPEFFTYENRHGQTIQGMMFKPSNVSNKKKVPLLIYVYGGPLGTRKTVVDGSYHSGAYFFQRYMAEVHGYLTVAIDPRGVSGYGGLFEKSNYDQVGKPQVEDLQDGVEFLVKNHNVDPEKVGMHGWSFGGFQTQMCMYTAPETFKVGIAGAGPTEWENYNQWYTSGTIGDSEVGKAELKKFSLIPLAKNLEGKLLLVHGMEDPNVLFQDTVAVYRALLQAGKEAHVDLFLDPTGAHGLGGDVKTINRYRKYEEYLTRTLGTSKK